MGGGRRRWLCGVGLLLADNGYGFGGLATYNGDALVEDGFARGRLDEVHLVDEDKDLGFARVLNQSADDVDIGGHVSLNVSTLYVEDIDEHANVAEDVSSLLGEVVLHKGLLATTVPEVERQVSKELDMG